IDDAPAGTIDDPDAILHRDNALCIDDVPGLLDEGGMHRNEIRGPEELIKRRRLDTQLDSPLFADKRIISQTVHSHGIGPLCYLAPDPANPDYPQGLLIQFHPHE